ncbi:hypothetical protein ACLOJK_015070 [Asimina triloba]
MVCPPEELSLRFKHLNRDLSKYKFEPQDIVIDLRATTLRESDSNNSSGGQTGLPSIPLMSSTFLKQLIDEWYSWHGSFEVCPVWLPGSRDSKETKLRNQYDFLQPNGKRTLADSKPGRFAKDCPSRAKRKKKAFQQASILISEEFSDLESVLTEEENPSAETLLMLTDISDDGSSESESEDMYTLEDIPCTPWPLEALTVPVATVSIYPGKYHLPSGNNSLMNGIHGYFSKASNQEQK